MSQITIKAKFNKMTKDSKKEELTFWVTGDDERKPEINQMTREMVILSLEDNPEVEIKCEFKKSSKEAKKTVLSFEVKGDSSADKTYEFYKESGSDVVLTIKEAQMSIEDVREEHEGIEYQTDGNGIVSRPDADPNQQTIDELEDAQRQVAAGSEEDEHGDDDLKEEI